MIIVQVICFAGLYFLLSFTYKIQGCWGHMSFTCIPNFITIDQLEFLAFVSNCVSNFKINLLIKVPFS